MKREKDILEELDRHPFRTPERYFDRLKTQLKAIPAAEAGPVRCSLWQRLKPYAALAACFAASLVIGNTILRKTAPDATDSLYDQLVYSDLIPVTQPNALYDNDTLPETSEEDIANFLIESGVSAELIAYVELQNEEQL